MMHLDPNHPKPIYEQIILNIKKEVLQGILLPGEKLPSVRTLAKDLSINPNTISKAYKELENQEVIISVKGKGSFVRNIEPENTRSVQDEKKLKQQLREWLVEAHYLQVPLKTIYQWIDEEAQENLHGN
ncbi:GntR family transcriptional regulator [Lactococcus kimchii]|nr:GntR family transcriptional regulator [Lactococcus sp. S-13]